MRKQFWTAALCLGVMVLCAGNILRAADTAQSHESDLKAKMQSEGWKQITEGVFERQRGGNKVEHLGYGREGLTWTLGELVRQLNVLHQEYQKYPSEDLAKIIDHLSIKIANAKRELRNMETKSALSPMLAGAPCNICYSATADAYPLSGSSQGVGAIADAKFNSDCGYSGDSYAYAYSRATLNGTTTTVSQEDPHTGTSVTSHASATVSGTSNCSSTANSYAQSSALGISYSTSDSNSLCPAPAFSVAIGGPGYVYGTNCKNVTWTSTITGGTSAFTYAWTIDGTAAGTSTSTSVSRIICYSEDVAVALTVHDSASHTASATYTTTVDIEPGCNPICP